MLITAIQNFRQSGALLDRAVKRLWQGGWLALPSECGYRVVVRGDREGALDTCRSCLPRDHRPWGLLVEEHSQADEYCTLTPQETALARFFWPGPLVLVSRRKSECPLHLTGRKLALRCPNHPLLAEMQRRCSFPLLSRGLRDAHQRVFTSAGALANYLREGGADLDSGEVLKGNAPCLSLTPTVAEMTPQGLRLLRLGFVTVEELRLILPSPYPLMLSDEERGPRRRDELSPRIHLTVVEGEPARVARRLKSLRDSYGQPPLVLLSQETAALLGPMELPWWRVVASREAPEYAEILQRRLQELEISAGESVVLVEGAVREGRGALLMARLERQARLLINTEDPGFARDPEWSPGMPTTPVPGR